MYIRWLILFIWELERYHIQNIVVDFGYESEENYCSYETLSSTKLYVKPSDHEQRKTRKYRTDISRRENTAYNSETDSYTCAAGKPIIYDYDKHSKSKTGLELTTSVYSCKDCADCLPKEKCNRARSKKPLEDQNKAIYVSERFPLNGKR